jgi:hypothetical protein
MFECFTLLILHPHHSTHTKRAYIQGNMEQLGYTMLIQILKSQLYLRQA